MVEALHSWINSIQSWVESPQWAVTLLLIITLLLSGGLIDLLLRRVLLSSLHVRIANTKTALDDLLWQSQVFRYLAHLVPGLLFYYTVPWLFVGESLLEPFLYKLTLIYLGLFSLLLLSGLTNVLARIAEKRRFGRRLPIRSLQQLTKLMLTIIFILFLVSMLLNKSPLYLLSGLGAFTAILLLVFKDTILGFVGGLQLAINDMVRQGDWVEMPKYGADGNIIDIGLTTVKIQNWDKTITTVPTHAMISEAFKNWRGMENGPGRRIKRAIYLDLSSIGFLSQQQWQKLAEVKLIHDYLERKKRVLGLQGEVVGHPINQRQLTNIGTFRAYLLSYLREHPMVNQDMTLLVRQLNPTEHGLPLEIYCFCRDKEWANYESIQADIFDHIYAILPCFSLRPFQLPAGNDINRLQAHAITD